MDRHSIRAEHGISAGKFISQKRKKWRENVLNAKRKKPNEECDKEKGMTYTYEGRHVVELDRLAKDLWCKKCNLPLSLRNTESEKITGLASELLVRCAKCKLLIQVKTGKSSWDGGTHYRYDVNVKLAFAIIDAGIGETQINLILTALNIHPISKSLLKRHERIQGRALESLANESCRMAVRLERNLTIAANASVDLSNAYEELNNNPSCSNSNSSHRDERSAVPLKASFDAGWQKRGTGHAYNSLTGHASLIGYHSGKVVAFATRTKKCAMCNRGHVKTDHDCRLNFDRSAKSMEPDMAIELITQNNMFNEENVIISVMIGDDDASSISAVRREASHQIEKWSDLNHAKKGLTSALYALKLPKVTIDYFARSFSCALKKNKGNASAVEAAIINIVHHAYGNHENCGDWCRSRTDGGEYVHANFPNGRPLTDLELRANLTNIFRKYANNAIKLAPCGSSQANESFNNLVSTKHNKNRFYGGSESFAYRVAAAVCQKNIGTIYAAKVFERLSLSPGNNTIKHREKKDEGRAVKAEKAALIETKRRRLDISKERARKNAATQRREGITYETECGLSGVSELMCNSLSASDNIDWTNHKIVLFDLESSGLSHTAEICQIAAATQTEVFNVYMVPTSMSSAATAVTGLSVDSGELYLNDKRLDTVPLRLGLLVFISFLRDIGGKVILVAHNGFRFDAQMILRNMRKTGLLADFTDVVTGFADTLHIFRERLEDRRKNKQKFSQTALAIDYLGNEAIEGAHDAQNDIRILRQLIDTLGIKDEDIQSAAKPTREIMKEMDMAAIHATNRATLQNLKPGVSVGMISKIAKSDISMCILQKAYLDGGEGAIKMLLGEDIGGRPRVTKNAKVVKGVVDQLEKINSADNL